MESQQISGITATDGAKVFAGTNTTNTFNIGNAQDLLPCASQAPFNAHSRQNDALCLPGTRIEVLNIIREWLDSDGQRHIFWLAGWAGTGKSTIARTVAREVYDHHYWTASFFFSRGGGDISHGERFVSTVAQQLANKNLEFRTLLQEVISRDQGIVQRVLTDQWRELIARPISRLDHSSRQSPLVVVVDALDECQSTSDIQQILQLLADPSVFGHIRLRVLITSRPESHIRDGLYRFLAEKSRRYLVLHDMDESTVDHDIEIFFRDSLSRQNVGDHVIKKLVRRSAGLFIWAATACRFITKGKMFAAKRLDTVLQDIEFDSAPEKHLDSIYLTILKQSLSPEFTAGEKDELCDLLRKILGSVVVLLSPLSAHSLSGLLAIPEDNVREVLQDCHSILDIPEDKTQSLRLHHPSFRDFLLDSRRCQDQSFRVDEQKAHRVLFKRCVDVICSNLKRDICDVRAPATTVAEVPRTRVNKCLLPEVRYACLYWIPHLLRAKWEGGDREHIQKILEVHFLHWVEALAWMQKTSEAILAMTALDSSFLQEMSETQALLQRAHDASRFIRYHRVAIESCPLQVYTSSLIFSPIQSLTRDCYENDRPKCVLNESAIDDNWSPCLYTLEGHTHLVESIAWSQDGSQLASASDDKTVRIWDPATGQCTLTLEGHTHLVESIAWSQDESRLASASFDKTVRIWDPATGHCTSILEGHTDWVRSIAWLQDEIGLASASNDGTVRIWDPATGQCRLTLDGHSDSVVSIAWSQDRIGLVSASYDTTVRIWDPATGQCRSTLEGHNQRVQMIAWSQDGSQLASASDDRTVRIWDPATGQCISTLEGHSGWVRSITWLQNGSRLASASGDRTVRIWDPATGQCISILKGHEDLVWSIAWSQNGSQLASASDDETVRIWNPATGNCTFTLQHNGGVRSIAWSQDGSRLASSSRDQTVRIWDLATRQCTSTLKGHIGWVRSIAWSQDRSRLASASRDQTVRVWDLATGQCTSILEGHTHWVISIAWSQSGSRLASASRDETVRIWDPATGQCISTLEGHSGWAISIVWSQDGSRLASADDKKVRVWDPATGQCTSMLEGHNHWAQSITWSQDGSRQVPIMDEIVQIWDLATRQCTSTLEGHSDWIISIVWSQDGSRLASADEKKVRVWDPDTGQCISTLKGHSGWVMSIAWSQDGSRLASASFDRTVRIWDPVTGQCTSTLEGHSHWVISVTWSQDGSRLASASFDGMVRIWEPVSGQCALGAWTIAPSTPSFREPLDVGSSSGIQFDHVNSNLLHTSFGTINLESGVSVATAPGPSVPLPRPVGYGLTGDRNWITYRGENVLWLPPEYRPVSYAISEATLAMGCVSGRVFILRLREDGQVS